MAESLKGDPRFHAILDDMRRLHERKAHDYGQGEDPLANLRAAREFGLSPVLGIWLRMNDKMTRLKSLSVKGRLQCESVEDTLRDLAAYAVLSLIFLQEEKESRPQQQDRDQEKKESVTQAARFVMRCLVCDQFKLYCDRISSSERCECRSCTNYRRLACALGLKE